MLSPHTIFFDDYWFQTNLPSIIVYIVVSLFTIFANLLLCVAFWKDPFRELQTAQNYYVLNLGLADLIMGAVSEPLLIVTYWNDNNLIFLIHYLFAIVSASSSLLNITALSIIRYFAVQRPFQTQNIVNGKSVKISIGVIWGIAFHFAVIPLLGWRDNTFQLYLYVLGCVIPTLVFIVAYFMVYRALRHHTRMIERLGQERSLHLQNVIRAEQAATRTVLLVLIVFLVLWIPFLSIDFAMVQCEECRTDEFHLARDITLSLVYFSSGINPVIYAWRIKAFRRAFLRVTGIRKIALKRTNVAWNKISGAGGSVPALTSSSCKRESENDENVNVMDRLKIDSIDSGCSSMNP